MTAAYHLSWAQEALLAGKTRTALKFMHLAQVHLDAERDANFEQWNAIEAQLKEQRWATMARTVAWAIEDGVASYIRRVENTASDITKFLENISHNTHKEQDVS